MAQKKDKKSKYGDWQLMRMRDCLHAYFHYGSYDEAGAFTWKDVAEAIEEETDVVVPHERLRQFVRGTVIKLDGIDTGTRKYGEMAEERLDAIVEFLLKGALELADPAEFEIERGDFQGPLQLLSYLRDGQSKMSNSYPQKLNGRFYSHRDNSIETRREITFEEPLESGLIKIRETWEYFDPPLSVKADEVLVKERHKNRVAYHRYDGWAVLDAENNLILFMKSENQNRTHYYINLGIDEGIRRKTSLDRMVLMHIDFPMTFRNDSHDPFYLAKQCHEEFQFKIHSFIRSLNHD